jgi:hypothetical protein
MLSRPRAALAVLVVLAACFVSIDVVAIHRADASPAGYLGELRYQRLQNGMTLASAADIEAGIFPKGRFVPLFP